VVSKKAERSLVMEDIALIDQMRLFLKSSSFKGESPNLKDTKPRICHRHGRRRNS